MMGVLFLGLKWCGLLLGVAFLLRLLIPVKLQRRTCPRCTYDMTGIETSTCPECGNESRNENKLWRKPVRKRHLALLLALLAVAYTGYTGERIIKHNWTAGVPSTALILAMPKLVEIENAHHQYLLTNAAPGRQGTVRPQAFGQVASDLLFALEERAKGRELPMWSWQRRMLRTKAAAFGRDGENMLTMLGGWHSMTDDQRDLLLKHCVSEAIVTRQRTPVDHPIMMQVRYPTMLATFQVNITPAHTDAQTMRFGPGTGREFPRGIGPDRWVPPEA